MRKPSQVMTSSTPLNFDVRSPAEFETVHIHGAVNVPLPLLEEHTQRLAAALDGPTLLVCQSGVRATHVSNSSGTVAIAGGVVVSFHSTRRR